MILTAKVNPVYSLVLILSDNLFATHLTFVFVLISLDTLRRLLILVLPFDLVCHIVHVNNELAILIKLRLFLFRPSFFFLGQKFLGLLGRTRSLNRL